MGQGVSTAELPRIAYVADLPIEGAMAGAAALYRLLSGYPPDRLRILLSNLAVGAGYVGAPRLHGVSQQEFYVAHPRLLYTRLSRLYQWYILARAPASLHRLRRLTSGFGPGAVLTVTVGAAWRAAAALASNLGLPLYVVLHDDWRVNLELPVRLQRIAEGWFAQVYRQAAGRFVVSPYMAAEFERRYGGAATVLYPSRAKEATVFEAPPERIRDAVAVHRFVYAGSVFPRYAELLAQFARVLRQYNATLTLYCPLQAEEVPLLGLDLPNVQVRPAVPTAELTARLRDDADVLVLPMSFHAADRANIELAFPSKLADYTAAGLPIFIWAPPYSSAARWANEHPGVAALVDVQSDAALQSELDQLVHSWERRWRLGQKALRVGESMFAHERVRDVFYAALVARGRPDAATAAR